MLVLTQFVLRLSFGLAFSMGLTSSRQVTSGYFRNHAYVLLGLNVLAILAAVADSKHLPLWPPVVGAILCYACSAVWLYEKARAGKILLFSIAAVSFLGVCLSQRLPYMPANSAPIPWNNITVYRVDAARSIINQIPWRLDAFTSGLLLGSTIAAMFLGHWYLNTPTMELAPLRKLITLMSIATIFRAAVCGGDLSLEAGLPWLLPSQYAFVALRWLAGIVGTAILCAMTWQTLKIPNTQSATGILYVAVITTFIGELTSLLLSANTAYPL